MDVFIFSFYKEKVVRVLSFLSGLTGCKYVAKDHRFVSRRVVALVIIGDHIHIHIQTI